MIALAILIAGPIACSSGAPRRQPARSVGPTERTPAFVAAQDLAAAGRPDEARAAFQAIRRQDPGRLEAFRNEIGLTVDPAAIRELADELDALVVGAETMRRRADYMALRALLEKNDIERERRLSAALSVDATSSLANLELAILLARRGDDAQAAENFAAAAGEGAMPEAVRRYAATLIDRHEYDEAIAQLGRYLVVIDDDAQAHYNLGTLLLNERNDAATAWTHLSRAAELAPGDVDILVNAAAAAMASGQRDAPLTLLNRAKRLDPKNPDTYFNLAVYYADHARDSESAITNFETYLRLGGSDKLRVARWIDELKSKAAKS